MVASEPHDSIVERCILTSLAKLKVKTRSNKLRKIVCRDISDTSWTQFQRVLDTMIAKHEINTENVGGDIMISSKQGFDADNTKQVLHTEKDSEFTTVLEVPCAVFGHLTSKGRKKQKNIEENTRTKISYESHPSVAKRKDALDENVSLTISKPWRKSEGKQNEEEKAKSHLQTAKLMILKMVDAYKKNPEHFQDRKAGGTMAEQEESKRKRLLSARKRGKIPSQQQSKKRRRKFY